MFFNADTVGLMKQIVPEFVSNNSELCKLDNKLPIEQKGSKHSDIENKEKKRIL